ncbi:serine/threonine protein phosphatase [Spirochaetia bacterium]|nr:serine/threonine protein phosphatase [Spirochaetia bacterium]
MEMVVRRVPAGAFVFLFVSVLLCSCDMDLLGLLGSRDFEERLDARNTFNFLTTEDRSLTLPDTYSFIVLSDTHIQGGDAHGLEKLKNVINDSLIDSDPLNDIKFVVITGDITDHGERKEVQKFIEIARTFGVPCYPVLGNHDVYFGHWSVWKDLIGSSSYRIEGPGSSTTLFIMDSANATWGARQTKWLDNELASAKDRVFVFTHANLFVKNPGDIEQFTDVRERSRIMSMLKGRCDAVFAGHVHRRIIQPTGGVKYITIEDYRTYKTCCRVSVSPAGLSYNFFQL